MSTAEAKDSYHHGDLRAALLSTAMEMLEAGEPFSLRALARQAGVSATAPYRHFEGRDRLESALAAEGFRDLKLALLNGGLPTSARGLGDFAVAYVDFARRRPALFRLMFGTRCDDENDERVRATADLHQLLELVLAGVFPRADAPALATAGWGLAHGLACLYLDGKLSEATSDGVASRVRAAFDAILAVDP